jgi:kumamolisin
MLPDSVRVLQSARVRAVQPLRQEHLGKQIEFQVTLRMRNFPKFLARVATGVKVPPDEMEATYLPLPADYQAVVDWAKSQGLTVTKTDPHRLGLFIKGTVAQIQTATQVQFAEVTVADGTYTSAITTPSLPAALSKAVLGVNGLQPHIHPHHVASGLQPQIKNNPPYLVKEIEGAYDATNLGYTGAGQTIAILIDTFPESTDLTSFWSFNGIPQSLSNIQEVQAVPGTLDPIEGEETLDTEWTSGIASGATVRIYATTDLSFIDLDKGLEAIIADLPNFPTMQQLSISLGLGETEVASAQKMTDSQYFSLIANDQVTIFVSSGDDGSEPDSILQPSYFSSDPSVTGVGGTTLNLYSSGAVQQETAWDGSGGGISSFFSRPSWQIGTGVPAGNMRLVPDVACAADPYTGAYIFLQGAGKDIGGTSWATPTWAGFCALINEARSQNGLGPIGMLNPKIYPLIGSGAFRDITVGSNGDYDAGAGYDLVTGIGTPMVAALLQSLTAGGGTNPLITSFSPTAGAVGSSVTINGVNLDRVTGVEFNGTTAQFTPGTTTSISATVPAGATTGPIELLSGTNNSTVYTSANPYTVVVLPANDDFADATIISGTSGQVQGSNIAATVEAGEPTTIDSSLIGASVWWVWQAPDNGTYTFTTAGSTFDTTEGIYTGADVGDLTTIGADDDYGTSITSSVTFTATPGATYYIQVAGHQGEAATPASGAITLTWEENANNPVISGFTPEAGVPGTIVTVNGQYFLGTTGVTLGGTTAAFNVVSDSQLTIAVPQGALTGPIAVTGPQGVPTVSTSNFMVVSPIPNDNFANATQISGPSGTISGDNSGATREPGEPEITGNPGGSSIWYVWTASFTGPITFTTFGSSFNTLLGVYTGTNVAALTLVTSDDDYGNTPASSVTFSATAGVQYYIAVDGYNGATGSVVLNWSRDSSLPVVTGFTPAAGPIGTTLTISGSDFTGATVASLGTTSLDFTVVSDTEITAIVPAGSVTGLISVGNLLGTVNSANQFTVTAAPSNDTFATSIPLIGSPVHTTGANVGAGLEQGDPSIAGNPGGARVWWSWTAPTTGVYAISTQGSNFDTLLAVYTGNSINSLSLVAANDDDPAGGSTSYVTITATAQQQYQIAVDGLNGASGSISLSIFPQLASTGLYSTGFEVKQGFTAGTPFAGPSLQGEDGWQVAGSGGNGVLVGADGLTGQQAYVGKVAPTAQGDTGVTVDHPVDYSPVGTTEPIVTFSTTMAINDSTNSSFDDFLWRLYDSKGHSFFALDFSNADLQVSYIQDGSSLPVRTGVHFANDTPLKLVVTMDYSKNKWSATLNGFPLVQNLAIRTGSAVLDFGYMAAVWQISDLAAPGDNYMVFDDYSIVAGQNPTPKITFQPQTQSVVRGNTATLGVVATGETPLFYQWFQNKKPVAGAVDSSLTIANAQPASAGSYTVQVSNPAGLVTSTPAILTVTPLPSVPQITENPPSITVAAGSTAVFQTAATAYPAATFQWFFNGSPIRGATKTTLDVHDAQVATSQGNYTVVASNTLGSGTSTPAAVLTVGNSFTSEKGNFNGMVFNGSNDVTGSGVLKVTMGAGGTFTGTVSLAGATYRMAGSFNAEGEWHGTVGRAVGGLPIIVTLQLSLSGTNQITGTVLDGTATETVTALRDNYSKTGTLAPQLPAYTLILTGTSTSLPQGIGYASITVDTAGNVRATGRLGDNTVYSVSSVLSSSGAWPFYASLYNSKGYIGGTLTFVPAGPPDISGSLNWVRPATAGFGGFSSGFSGSITAAGYVYTPPAKNTPAIPLSNGQGTITFSGNILNSNVTGGLSLSPTTGTLVSGNPAIKLTLIPATGVFSGTVETGFGLPQPFSGVLLQSLDEGSGLFQSPTISGQVEITSP